MGSNLKPGMGVAYSLGRRRAGARHKWSVLSQAQMGLFVPGTIRAVCTRYRILDTRLINPAPDLFGFHTKYPREFNVFVNGCSFDIINIDYHERVKNYE
jgi:hypothetical protein